MEPELETRLRGHMTVAEWAAFKAHCLDNGIPMDDESDEYGHIFLIVKHWFLLGWNSNKATL